MFPQLSDNLLTCIVRAWRYDLQPKLFAQLGLPYPTPSAWVPSNVPDCESHSIGDTIPDTIPNLDTHSQATTPPKAGNKTGGEDGQDSNDGSIRGWKAKKSTSEDASTTNIENDSNMGNKSNIENKSNLENNGISNYNAENNSLCLNKPFFVAPAMNTWMWWQGVTAEHLGVLQKRGVRVLEPRETTLACGDFGYGAMMNPKDIVEEIRGMGMG
jgi:hypothetical protein